MTIGFIGCGNMGGALALAVSRSSEAKLLLCDTDPSKAAALSLATGGKIATINEVAEKSDYVFIGVKPIGCASVLGTIKNAIFSNTGCVLISMMAGVTISKIESFFDSKPPVIRIMPNTPVSVGCGMTVYSANAMVSDKMRAEFSEMMKESGMLYELPEDKIDAACSVMGCGPAFAYKFAAALAEGGVEAGLDEDEAILFAAQMMKGAAQMLLRTDKTPERLCSDVCSPGGSTIEGVKVLDKKNFGEITRSAVAASFARTKELGK
jgi:pyrroline-5-carboxylate reductase